MQLRQAGCQACISAVARETEIQTQGQLPHRLDNEIRGHHVCLRQLAANELREVAATPVAYSADLPDAERQAAALAWQRWFTKGGHRP